MASSFGYILQTTSTSGAGSVTRPYVSRADLPFLGFGLITPFRRDKKSDFAASGGEVLVRSCVSQVPGTECSDDAGNIGELPWRPEFGSVLYKLRHRPNDEVMEHVARVYVAEAIQRWEPRVVVKEVTISRRRTHEELDTLLIHLRYDVIASNVPGNQVIIRDVSQTLELAA